MIKSMCQIVVSSEMGENLDDETLIEISIVVWASKSVSTDGDYSITIKV